MSSGDPIAPNVQALMEIYSESAGELSFPGVDQHTLLGHADAVRAQASEVEAARRALEDARANLELHRSALLEHARLGLAYARVFARADEDLAKRLEAICLDAAAPSPRARRSRRKKKDTSETLPLMAVG